MMGDNDSFVCEHCGKKVLPLQFGGHFRNHCPFCLWSKHVDGEVSGDRAGFCGGMMEPKMVTTRRTGEYVLTHKCTKCGMERYNRVAADDNAELLSKLSGVPVK